MSRTQSSRSSRSTTRRPCAATAATTSGSRSRVIPAATSLPERATRALRDRLRPRRPDEEVTNANRRERRLPAFEPVLVAYLMDRELGDRTEAEGLKVPERISDVRDFRVGIGVQGDVRLDSVVRAAN